jgi:hypothetical protein
MKTSTRLATLAISAFSLLLAACGGGGDLASGGIGGSGIQVASIGPVSEVGSITVNGVRYETTGAVVQNDDGIIVTENDLQVGSMVEVDGRVDSSGNGGTALQVTVVTAVQGPVDEFQINNGLITLTVMGQPVVVDDQTQAQSLLELNALIQGDLVAISGAVDPRGAIRALRIEKKTPDPDFVFKVRGFVDSVSGTALTINNLTVVFGSAELSGFDAAPQAGDFIAVRGTAHSAGTLIADRIENASRAFADDQNAEIEGFITAVNGSAFTLVSGAGVFVFQTTAATEFKAGARDDLAAGLKVEVEGVFSNGVMIADEISVKDGIQVEATLDTLNLNVPGRRITLLNLSALELVLDDQTVLRDGRLGNDVIQSPTVDQLLLSLSQANDNPFIKARARARELAPGVFELIATELRVEPDPQLQLLNVRLRGPLDALPNRITGEFSILGVVITPNFNAQFLAEDTPLTRVQFFDRVSTGSLVDAIGTTSRENLIAASRLELED